VDIEFSPKRLAELFIISGVVVVFMLMGGSLTQLFSASIQKVFWFRLGKEMPVL
jgi:hypothetical protein